MDVFSLQLQGPSPVQHSHLKPGRHRPYSAQPPHHPGLLPFTAQFCVYFQVLSRSEVLTHLYKPGVGGSGGRLGEVAGKESKKERAQMSIEAHCVPGTRVGALRALSPVIFKAIPCL